MSGRAVEGVVPHLPITGKVTAGSEKGSGMKKLIHGYRVRNPDDELQVYAEEIEDRDAAMLRAQEIADFYRHPVEVVELVGGAVTGRVGDLVRPAPMAPGETT